MADEIKQADGKEVSPTVALFQKAHASLVTLQRIDEQLISLAERRRKVQVELRDAQTQLNEEMDRAAAMPQEMTSPQVTVTVPRPKRPEGAASPLGFGPRSVSPPAVNPLWRTSAACPDRLWRTTARRPQLPVRSLRVQH
jgi:hypothetical protein